jgi:hypothetical protein
MIQKGSEIGFLMIDRVVPINMVERTKNEELATHCAFQLFKDNIPGPLSFQTGYSIYAESDINVSGTQRDR